MKKWFFPLGLLLAFMFGCCLISWLPESKKSLGDGIDYIIHAINWKDWLSPLATIIGVFLASLLGARVSNKLQEKNLNEQNTIQKYALKSQKDLQEKTYAQQKDMQKENHALQIKLLQENHEAEIKKVHSQRIQITYENLFRASEQCYQSLFFFKEKKDVNKEGEDARLKYNVFVSELNFAEIYIYNEHREKFDKLRIEFRWLLNNISPMREHKDVATKFTEVRALLDDIQILLKEEIKTANIIKGMNGEKIKTPASRPQTTGGADK